MEGAFPGAVVEKHKKMFWDGKPVAICLLELAVAKSKGESFKGSHKNASNFF